LTVDKFTKGFAKILGKAGDQIRIRYFTGSIGSVWDDDKRLVKSGADLWTSGVVLPINTYRGSTDSLLMEQGLLTTADKRLFIHGSLFLTGSNAGSDLKVKIQIGSPTGDEYHLIPEGGIVIPYAGTDIYKKAYIRMIAGGSLIGEV